MTFSSADSKLYYMSANFLKRPVKHAATLIIGAAVVFAGLAYGGFRYRLLAEELKDTRNLLKTTTIAFESRVAELENDLAQTLEANRLLSLELGQEQSKNTFFEGQIRDISQTVGELLKLKKIDPELLQKYSRVYFLNENYFPSALTQINSKYISNLDKPQEIHAQVYAFLQKFMEAALGAGLDLRILSGYRSFYEQSTLKQAYQFTYGTGANQFSADQGYSEHQLGTAVDFTTSVIGTTLSKFESSTAYAWLLNNAHQYGFILSYPKENTYYAFEPWHWRFVGAELAAKLHSEGKYFYDLDQREIDQYLIKIFD